MEHKTFYQLSNIVDFCDGISKTVNRFGDDFGVFDGDADYQDACEMKIVQIGEIVNSLDASYKDAHPEIPWRNIIGTRNIIIHDYGVLSNAKVWEMIKRDIPALREFCTKQIG